MQKNENTKLQNILGEEMYVILKERKYRILAVVILILSVVGSYMIYSGADGIGEIRSVGGQSMAEVYYNYLGIVYKGFAFFVLSAGIFFAAILDHLQK